MNERKQKSSHWQIYKYLSEDVKKAKVTPVRKGRNIHLKNNGSGFKQFFFLSQSVQEMDQGVGAAITCSTETEWKCFYLNMGKIHLLIFAHKFDLIPSAVLRDQRSILRLWIMHCQTCGMSACQVLFMYESKGNPLGKQRHPQQKKQCFTAFTVNNVDKLLFAVDWRLTA